MPPYRNDGYHLTFLHLHPQEKGLAAVALWTGQDWGPQHLLPSANPPLKDPFQIPSSLIVSGFSRQPGHTEEWVGGYCSPQDNIFDILDHFGAHDCLGGIIQSDELTSAWQQCLDACAENPPV